MGFSVQKMAKPLITATAAIVLLGTGTGTALAATSDATPHHAKYSSEASQQRCFDAQNELALKLFASLVVEGGLYVGDGYVTGVSLGSLTVPYTYVSGGVTAADIAWEAADAAKVAQICKGVKFSPQPKPKLPPWLAHLKTPNSHQIAPDGGDE